MAQISETLLFKLIHYGMEFIGRYYSTYRGYVVDNNDPKGMNRVKVISPIIAIDDNKGIWAFPKHSWGGNNYGTQWLPEIGDTVYLEFEYGDLDYPIWSHHSYALNEKPGEFDKPNKRGFKTPLGNTFIIDEGTNGNDGSITLKFKSNTDYFSLIKDTLELESKLIKLGKNGDEQAILGNTLLDKLNKILDNHDNLYQLIMEHTHTSNMGPTGTPINNNQISDYKEGLIDIKNSLTEILSNKVKLDK